LIIAKRGEAPSLQETWHPVRGATSLRLQHIRAAARPEFPYRVQQGRRAGNPRGASAQHCSPAVLRSASVRDGFEHQHEHEHFGRHFRRCDFGNQGIPTTGNIGGSLNWLDSPTVTITPRQGTEILGPLTSRMSVLTIAKMANAGYRFDFLLSLMAEGLTDVRGPQTGVGTDFRPGDKEFIEAHRIGRPTDRQRTAQSSGTFSWNDPYSDITYKREDITVENQLTAIALGGGVGRFRSYDGGKTYYFTDKNDYPAMWIDPDARTSGDGKRVIELLNLQPTPLKRVWTFAPSRVVDGTDFENVPDDPRPEIRMRLRSFYSVLNLLAYGIDIPPKDEEEGRAFTKASYDQAVREGRAVDLSDKFVVHSSSERPANAFVAVKHRGSWFYVDDRDHVSKRFFNAVYDLFNMEIAPSGGGGGPILTVPVK
jgi:hypothetical protein